MQNKESIDNQYHFKVKIPWYQNYLINIKRRMLKFRFSFTRRFLLSPLFWANIWILLVIIALSFIGISHIRDLDFKIFLFEGPFSFEKYNFAIINIKDILYVIGIWLILNLIVFIGSFNTAKNASPFMINTIFAIMFILNIVFVAIIYIKFKFLKII